MKTAVIYARYSSDSQTEQSIEGQLRVCHEYAKQHDTVILDAYIDRAMTGTNDNRPAFQKMIRDSEKQHWDYVIVYKLDRFARNKYESVINKKRLQDNNVKLMSAMENLTDTPEGRMMECFLEGMNQYFSEELMQKVRRGLNESWLKGNATGGRKVFGYDVVNQKYVINEKEAATILEIFTKYSQGYTAEEIAKSLQERGIKYHDEKYLSNRTIFKLLHKLKYTGNIIKAIEEGIITEQTKTRLKELEMQINQYDFEIDKEKQKTQQYLSREQIKNYISSKFNVNSTDLQFRKMIVNTFIREIVFFEDKLIITYNFAPPTETVAIDAKATIEIEKQSESAFSFYQNYSSILSKGAPKRT